LIVSEYTLGYN